MNGFVFYQGLSRLDRKPIVGIATLKSANRKTGNLVQTWILRSDISPMESIHTGEDHSICGDCPFRGTIEETPDAAHGTRNKGRACYVLVNNAPSVIYRTYKRKKYPKFDARLSYFLEGRHLRYGAYGDPTAIPLKHWDTFAKFCTGKHHVGYTHQWRKPKFQFWSKRLMASTHSEAENELALAMGWRTFRTAIRLSDITKLEIVCPSSNEVEKKRSCAECGICDGRDGTDDKRKSVIIVGHGLSTKQAAERIMTRINLPLL